MGYWDQALSVVVHRQQVALNDNTYNIGLIQECSRVTINNNSYIKNMAARGVGGGGWLVAVTKTLKIFPLKLVVRNQNNKL